MVAGTGAELDPLCGSGTPRPFLLWFFWKEKLSICETEKEKNLLFKGGQGADSCFSLLWQTQCLSPWTQRSHNRSHNSNWKRLLFPAWEKMKEKWRPSLLCHHTEMINPGWGDLRHFIGSPQVQLDPWALTGTGTVSQANKLNFASTASQPADVQLSLLLQIQYNPCAGDDYNLIYTSWSTVIQATTQSWNHGMVPSVCNCQGYVFQYIFCWRKGRVYNWVAIITVRACKISVRNHTLVCWRGDLHFILTRQNGLFLNNVRENEMKFNFSSKYCKAIGQTDGQVWHYFICGMLGLARGLQSTNVSAVLRG